MGAEVERDVLLLNRESSGRELEAVTVQLSDVRELRVGESARRRILHREQEVLDLAVPVGRVETEAVVEEPDLEATLDLRRHLRLEVRVTEIVWSEACAGGADLPGERRELRERRRLATGLAPRGPDAKR